MEWIGDNIKRIRKSKKIKAIDLAKFLGVSNQTIHKYENNIIKNIPLENLQKIAQALSIGISDLIDNNKNNTINNNNNNNNILILESLNIIENEMLKIRKLIL